MSQGQDEYVGGIHPINHTERRVEDLTERGQANLRNYPTAPRESVKIGNSRNQRLEPLLCAARTIVCDVVNGLERSLLSKHGPNDLHRRRRARSVLATAA